MLGSSKKTAVLCIAEKLNISLRLKVADLDQISYLITEMEPDVPELKTYQSHGVQLL